MSSPANTPNEPQFRTERYEADFAKRRFLSTLTRLTGVTLGIAELGVLSAPLMHRTFSKKIPSVQDPERVEIDGPVAKDLLISLSIQTVAHRENVVVYAVTEVLTYRGLGGQEHAAKVVMESTQLADVVVTQKADGEHNLPWKKAARKLGTPLIEVEPHNFISNSDLKWKGRFITLPQAAIIGALSHAQYLSKNSSFKRRLLLRVLAWGSFFGVMPLTRRIEEETKTRTALSANMREEIATIEAIRTIDCVQEYYRRERSESSCLIIATPRHAEKMRRLLSYPDELVAERSRLKNQYGITL